MRSSGTNLWTRWTSFYYLLSNIPKEIQQTKYFDLFIIKFFSEFILHNVFFYMLTADKSLQSCPTLCDPTDVSPPGSAVPGILQARTLEWVAISFSSAWKWNVKGKSLSRVQLLATPWTAAHQTSPSMGFSRQEYWSGVPLPSPTSLYNGHMLFFKTN